ncbi:MAG: response regulator [Planctomycetaceae bacterium]|nr:response regulator [Planctomycetaceae bacterium]
MNTPVILFVDDEQGVINACQRALRKSGFELLLTTSTDEALELARTRELTVVVSDQRMPGMEGTELLEQIRKIQPDTVRMILTGYADITATVDAINRGEVFRFLAKPWDDAQLVAVLNRAVDQYNLVMENRRLNALTKSQNDELKLLNNELEIRVLERTQQVTDLSSRLRAMLNGSLKVFAQLMDVTSSSMGNHSRRVAEMSMLIAEELSLPDEMLRQIEAGSLLHDIGKLMLPDALLKKDPLHLTADERSMLQQHVLRGESILQAIPFFNDAALFVRHHHERMNGTGYPDRLQGDEIPLGARIIAVADAWDKHQNDKKAYSSRTSSDVLRMLRDRAGDQFDPGVVDALERSLERNRKAAHQLDSVVEVYADALRPGMVLATAIKTDAGAMLMPAETQLTPENISRLRRFYAHTMHGFQVYRTAAELV